MVRMHLLKESKKKRLNGIGLIVEIKEKELNYLM
jgi:hypothetical protein